MDALRQRLKELDPITFQALCFDILKEKSPNLALRYVDGAAGDEGLDIFEGELFGQPTIWQCKSFPNGVGESQKKQIRKSLNTALKHFSPLNWILCLSVDMDAKAFRWFQKLQSSHRSRISIGLFPASDILHELIHRRSLRNRYFPDAVLDSVELRRIITKSGELTFEELERVTENNLEHFVERLKERDARCNYQIVFDGDMGPSVQRHPPRPGLLMSISTGNKAINVFARDVEALRSNPPTFSFTITEAGASKYRELMRTGASQEFTPNEFGSITSEWPILAPLIQQPQSSQARLVVGPSPALTSRKRNVRITFRRSGANSIEYGLMTLRPTRAGMEEAEFVCSGDALPFEIYVVVPAHIYRGEVNQEPERDALKNEKITFRNQIVGSNAKQAKKFLDAMSLLQPSGELEIFDLQEDKVLLKGKIELSEDSPSHQTYRKFVDDIAQISDRFRVDLRIPSKLTNEDFESIVLLKTLAEGGTLSIGNIAAAVVKSEENRDLLPQQLASGRGLFRFAHPCQEPKPTLFGVAIDTGPCAIDVDAEIVNLAATLEEFRSASIGDAVQMSFRPIRPARFLLLSPEEWSRGPAVSGNTEC